jgi:hypothetical protein
MSIRGSFQRPRLNVYDEKPFDRTTNKDQVFTIERGNNGAVT